jgi:hypothetical protein
MSPKKKTKKKATKKKAAKKKTTKKKATKKKTTKQKVKLSENFVITLSDSAGLSDEHVELKKNKGGKPDTVHWHNETADEHTLVFDAPPEGEENEWPFLDGPDKDSNKIVVPAGGFSRTFRLRADAKVTEKGFGYGYRIDPPLKTTRKPTPEVVGGDP